MKAYIAVTGSIFGLITLAHLWRITVEPQLATDPFYIVLTILAVALCGWSVWLLWAFSRK